MLPASQRFTSFERWTELLIKTQRCMSHSSSTHISALRHPMPQDPDISHMRLLFLLITNASAAQLPFSRAHVQHMHQPLLKTCAQQLLGDAHVLPTDAQLTVTRTKDGRPVRNLGNNRDSAGVPDVVQAWKLQEQQL